MTSTDLDRSARPRVIPVMKFAPRAVILFYGGCIISIFEL
jgi:hypothetical protein